MTQPLVLRFRDEVSLTPASEDQLTLVSPRGETTLTEVTPGLRAALGHLCTRGFSEDQLADLVFATDGGGALPRLYYHLEQFSRLQLLCYSLLAGDQTIATVVPMTTAGFQRRSRNVAASTRFRLSRFAYCRRDGDALVLESPLSLARTILPGSLGARLIAELAQPRTYRDLCLSVDDLSEDMVQAFVGILKDMAVIAEVDDHGELREDDSPALSQWAFHDLLFHSRSRLGRHHYPIGGTWPHLGKLPPLPALKPKTPGDVFALYKPDAEQLERNDTPFDRIVEARRSIRDYASQAITAQQLGEFLYRVARVRRVLPPDPERFRYHEVTSRPYPSGGATYDLELYVTINRCVGVPGGIYHYDPLAHALGKLAERNTHIEALLHDAQLAAALECQPQVLIILASRFQRVSWKYTGIAYATTLKNVGVLYQTMYLVAAAMGLAPCALGAGNAALLAETVGTDYFEESSVGEFLLGSAPSSAAPADSGTR
jgi:oxazoline/thiazoline dehydrogenase